MPGPFEIATKAALKELIDKHVQESKFGSFLSPHGQSELINDVYELILNSRQLKSVGDRMLGLNQAPERVPTRHRPPHLRDK